MTAPTANALFTLSDLRRGVVPPARLAVVGHPVRHSLSPLMHHAALAALAARVPRLADWRYCKFEVAPAELPEMLPRLHALGFAGLNFTVPHKEAVLALAEEVEEFARAAGAANTLVRTPTGWRAHNTDGVGLAAALAAEFGRELAGAPVVLLGAGGAARAAALHCLRAGVGALWIGNRDPGRLAALLAHLPAAATGVAVRGGALDALPAEVPAGAWIINATSVGLRADDPAPVDLRRWPRPALVYDMIYNPPETALLRAAGGLGVPRANGLSMLAHQGAAALSLWTGHAAPAGLMLAALRSATTAA